MKKLLLWLLPLLLTGCASLHGYTYEPVYHARHAIIRSVMLRNTPDSTWHTGVQLQPTGDVTVVGQQGIWAVIRYQGRRYFIRLGALGRYSWANYAYYGPTYYAPTSGYHDTYIGPRGGEYYYNGNGNQQYITPQSTIDQRTIYTGPRGGRYYINDNGNKTYIKR